jgi:hypothetical protein
MLNPYTLLTPPLLAAMLRQPMYFVRQYYPRGQQAPDAPPHTQALLLTHYCYTAPDKERADRHLRLLHGDRFRLLYNSTVPEQLEKLQLAAQQPAGYQVYINLLPKEWQAGSELKAKIDCYLSSHFPAWSYQHGDKLNVVLRERYGQLYLGLLWKGQAAEIPLEAVEDITIPTRQMAGRAA